MADDIVTRQIKQLAPLAAIPAGAEIAMQGDEGPAGRLPVQEFLAAADFSHASSFSPGTVGWALQKRFIFAGDAPYNVVPDGITDNAAGLQQAATDAAAAGIPLVLPSGISSILLMAKISVSTANQLVIIGGGRLNSLLYWPDTATSEGLEITYTDVIRPPRVEHVGFITGKLATGTGLTIIGPEAASVGYLGPLVQDLFFGGADGNADCWLDAMEFRQCWYITATHFTIKGKPTIPYPQSSGVKLTSSQVCWMHSFVILHVDIGIVEVASGVASHGEGFCFHDFEMVGVTKGIELRADGIGPGTNIGPGHINALTFGIDIDNQYQTKIHDMLIYKTLGSTSDFIGVRASNADSCHIHHNEIHDTSGSAVGSMTGIQLTGDVSVGSDYSKIDNNLFRQFGGSVNIGIEVGSGMGNGSIHDNDADGSVPQCVVIQADAQKTNRLRCNFPSFTQTLTANSATPSVGNDDGGKWKTANTNPTTITNLADVYVGQEIEILVADANTTFQHNGNFILKGGIDYAAPNGEILCLRRYEAEWREVSRRG